MERIVVKAPIILKIRRKIPATRDIFGKTQEIDKLVGTLSGTSKKIFQTKAN